MRRKRADGRHRVMVEREICPRCEIDPSRAPELICGIADCPQRTVKITKSWREWHSRPAAAAWRMPSFRSAPLRRATAAFERNPAAGRLFDLGVGRHDKLAGVALVLCHRRRRELNCNVTGPSGRKRIPRRATR